MTVRILVSTALMLVAAGAAAQPSSKSSDVVPVDRVLAVVNDEAVTQYEFNEARQAVLQQLKQQKVEAPASGVLDKQVLERMITQRALLQQAKEDGVRVDDTQVERAIARIAQENKMSADDFRKLLEHDKIAYTKYREDVRNEMIVQRLREREVDSKVQVTDAEVDQYLAALKAQSGGETEYHLAHILVLVPEQASAEQIEARRQRAEEALRSIKSGADFAQIAAGYSDAGDALQGGNLGWRSGARLPTVFTDTIREMKPGQVSGVLRSAAGFHIVKLIEKRSHDEPMVVDQTHVRHILIRVNELTSEAEAKAKIERLKDRIDGGASFADLAKLNSEDASAPKGGDLGWLGPGDTVPEFEEAMSKLAVNQVSAPVRTPFGWHLIEVLERRKQDVTAAHERTEAQLAIRQRKADDAFQDWVRQIRDKAFVEVRLDEK